MNTRFSKRLCAKFTKEEGAVSVEAVLVFPLLIWAITATFVFFDAFKSLHISQKATYTVADMLSREDDIPVTDDYLTAMHEVFMYLSKDSVGSSSIRVTVVERGVDVDGNEETTLVWSRGVNGVLPYANLSILEDRIPMMMDGDQLVIVETEHEWAPTFAVGLASYRFREVGISRPRFAPHLCFDDGTDVICSNSGGATGSSSGGDVIPDDDTT